MCRGRPACPDDVELVCSPLPFLHDRLLTSLHPRHLGDEAIINLFLTGYLMCVLVPFQLPSSRTGKHELTFSPPLTPLPFLSRTYGPKLALFQQTIWSCVRNVCSSCPFLPISLFSPPSVRGASSHDPLLPSCPLPPTPPARRPDPRPLHRLPNWDPHLPLHSAYQHPRWRRRLSP